MTTFKALGTARRNLWYRIDRYLAELEKRVSQPGRREGNHLLRAMDHFEAGTYAEGERDMMWAEVATRQPDASELHSHGQPAGSAEAVRGHRRGGVGRPPPPLATAGTLRATRLGVYFFPEAARSTPSLRSARPRMASPKAPCGAVHFAASDRVQCSNVC